jgi:hypothetical protein
MITMAHHLMAHWVDEDGGAVGTHHHLKEEWVEEDEAADVSPETPALTKVAA